MMSKSLNYAYPRKYAEGGDVAPDTRQRLEFTPSDDSGNSFRYVLYDDKGREAQAGVTQREYVESGLFGPGTDEKYNVSFLAPDTRQRLEFTPSDDSEYVESGLFGPGTNEKYNVSFLEQAPAPLPPEPQRRAASGSGSGLVDPETPTGYLSSDAAPPEQKSTSYAFMDADGNSYNMGDARPGHDGTSLERAIANVQEYYDFAPGSFTVSVPSEKRLVGTYDSDSGSFQAATSDMRDLNGFGPGVDLMRPVPDAPVFGGPVQPVVSPPDPILYFGPDGQPVYGGIFPDQPVRTSRLFRLRTSRLPRLRGIQSCTLGLTDSPFMAAFFRTSRLFRLRTSRLFRLRGIQSCTLGLTDSPFMAAFFRTSRLFRLPP
jgi:hypothetical protein